MDLELLRAFCLALPATTEAIKWEHDLCFSIADKMYCVANLELPFSFSFKATEADFYRLTEIDHFVPAPYLARYHWVLAQNGNPLKEETVKILILQSYESVKSRLPKRKRQELGLN